MKQVRVRTRPKEIAAMQARTKDQSAGKLHELKGTIKEKAVKVADNPRLEPKGTTEQTSGGIQKKLAKSNKPLGSR